MTGCVIQATGRAHARPGVSETIPSAHLPRESPSALPVPLCSSGLQNIHRSSEPQSLHLASRSPTRNAKPMQGSPCRAPWPLLATSAGAFTGENRFTLQTMANQKQEMETPKLRSVHVPKSHIKIAQDLHCHQSGLWTLGTWAGRGHMLAHGLST